jgi:arylsulfatase A-like enzyme
MTRFRRAALLGLLAVTLAALGWLLKPEPFPDVFLITVDTLRADHLGCYGSTDVRTPHVDRLAAEGLLFENAVAPLPETHPAHYTLFTSLYPRDHGVLSNASRPGSGHLTLPSLFRAGGYATAGFAACALFNGPFGTGLGFEHFVPSGEVELAAETMVPKALAWLSGIEPRRPVFLWLHLFDPHLPYEPPAEFDRAPPAAEPRLPRISWDDLTEIAGENGGDLPRDVLERARELYRGEVEYTDHWLGRFFDGLRAQGRFEDAVVLLTADHGECFENGVFFEHSTCLGEGALAVPLVLRHPRSVEAGRTGAMVELLDVAPTLLRLADLPVPDELRGRGLLERRDGEPPDAFFQYPIYPLWEAAQRREWFHELRSVAGEPVEPLVTDRPLAGVRRGRFKYLYLGDREALFDLEADPQERVDVAGERPEELRELRGVLEEWMAEHPLELDATGDLDPELLENLRALGYL